jgi:NADPH:quinone reductase-like Zn-dependent oxidoreductase
MCIACSCDSCHRVTRFRVGDDVFGAASPPACGAFAEMVVVREAQLALKPANITFSQAAGVSQAPLQAQANARLQVHAMTWHCSAVIQAESTDPQLCRNPLTSTSCPTQQVTISGSTALFTLGLGRPVRDGDRVLIVGASGCVGTFAVQLAR